MSDQATVEHESRLLIDGALREAESGARYDNINPATEACIGTAADGGARDLDAAIAAARRAFDDTDWATNVDRRARGLRQLCEALVRHRETLRQIVIAEAGSPLLLTYGPQCDTYIDQMPYWADLAERYPYDEALSDIEFMGQPQRRMLYREAIGVVGAITPWNFPLYLNLCKLGPALAAGNTVVLKPAPDTPWSATALGRLILEETDIPAGVVNIVSSADHELGAQLAADPRVDAITFTGSTATGRAVMAAAATTVKKVFLELGGKSANIVLDDADLDRVIPGVVSVCAHAGQGCALTTRLLLPRSLYEAGVAAATAALEGVAFGDPLNPAHLQGPLISARQRQRVLGYIEQGRAEGARLTTGGGIPAHLPTGYYVEPTVFADVDPKATIAQEEIFGPVLAIIPFADDAESVRIANDSIYGLSGAVHSNDEARALAVARQVRTGTMSINGAMWFSVETPFGGYRQSGLGRENGVLGFEEYLETKVVALPADSGR
jgi:aldehyde dehydrogenase (NAD+)